MEETKQKTCVTCAHFNTDHTGPVCAHPTAQDFDPIYGNPYSKSCYFMRGEGCPCGPKGSYWREA